ncbi:MAG: peptidoglycan D,D-transpeptidase FtsI family protein [Spirochaetota bacterium]
MDSSGKKVVYYLLITITALYILYVLIHFAVLMFPRQTEGYQQPLESSRVQRGSLYDRNGVLLAAEVPYYSCALMLQETDSVDEVLTDLSQLIDVPYEELKEQTEGKTSYAMLKRRLTEAERTIISQHIDRGQLPGITLEKRYGRVYPYDNHASQVIGFTNIDNIGMTGIEYQFDRLLSPLPDPAQAKTIGSDLFLTLDHRIQYTVDAQMEKLVEEHRPDSAVTIVADANTGEILANSSYPWFDLNDYNLSTAGEQQNRSVSSRYEPGSVFKIFSLAAVLEADEAPTDELFLCDGSYTFMMKNGKSTTVNCLSAHGEVGPEEMLKYSCNGAIAYYALETSTDNFYQQLQEFGFNRKTGIQLPAEVNGSLKDPSLWSGRSKPTIAFGQEIAVTAVQLVQAATALTNEGTMLQPRILHAVRSQGEEELTYHTGEVYQDVLSAEVAREVVEMMKAAVEPGGTASRAHRDHLEISAKTGTAQILDLDTNSYSDERVLASTLAIVPTDEPRYIIYTAADNPQSEVRYGSAVAAPLIKQVIDDLVSMGLLTTSHSTVITE